MHAEGQLCRTLRNSFRNIPKSSIIEQILYRLDEKLFSQRKSQSDANLRCEQREYNRLRLSMNVNFCKQAKRAGLQKLKQSLNLDRMAELYRLPKRLRYCWVRLWQEAIVACSFPS